MQTSSRGLIRVIAVFKLLKAAMLLVAGIGILKLLHMDDLGSRLEHWVRALGLDPDSRVVEHAIQSVTQLSPRRIKELGIVSFIYAGLFLTEGIGLWLVKRWAEWFTIIITSSLLPLEAWEIYRHPTAIKIAVLLINLGVVAYLVYRVRHEPAIPRRGKR